MGRPLGVGSDLGVGVALGVGVTVAVAVGVAVGGRRRSRCYCCGWCRRCSRCGSRRGRRCACRALHFKRTFIDPTIHDAIEPWPALIEERWRSKVRITRINSGTAGQQGMGECAGIATAKSSVTAVAANLTSNVILIFIQLLLTTKEH